VASNVPSVTLPDTSVTAQAPQQGPASQAPFAERVIALTLRLGTGSFGASGSNTLSLTAGAQPYSSLRASVKIELASTPHPSSCVVVVYGLTLDQINQLTKAGLNYDARSNQIMVQAGDRSSGLTTIYNGEFFQAYPKASQPDMPFVIIGNPMNGISLKPAAPASFSGGIQGQTALGQIVKSAGYVLENNGVSATLVNPYFPGTAWEQIKACVRAMNCYATVDSTKGVIAVWPRTGWRGSGITVISPALGMIDYPEFDTTLVRVRTLFNPAVSGVYSVGNRFQIPRSAPGVSGTQFAAAAGQWIIISIDYDLAAQTERGPWEMVLTGYRATPGT
jgi:hypothetical protein